MLIEIKIIHLTCKNNIKRKIGKTVGCFKCNNCDIRFEKQCKQKYIKQEYHFCSRECANEAQKSNGVLAQKKLAVFRKKYNADSPMQTDEVKKRVLASMRKSLFEQYGVTHSMQIPEVLQKAQQNGRKTLKEKYGVTHNMQLDKTKETRKKNFKKKYGVEHVFHIPEVIEKTKQTIEERYGVDNILKVPEVREKGKKTRKERYGDEYYNNREKAHQTIKKNKTYGKSKKEDLFYEKLLKLFKENEIERQALMNGWSIDFYIKLLDIYIQFDGVYWHGLDRQLSEIKQFKNPRDKNIYGSYLRDKVQNKWFKKNNLKLIRITDKEFNSSIEEVKKLIYLKLDKELNPPKLFGF